MLNVNKILAYSFGAFNNHGQAIFGREVNCYAVVYNPDGKGPSSLPASPNYLVFYNVGDQTADPVSVTPAELKTAFWRYIRGKKGSPSK